MQNREINRQVNRINDLVSKTDRACNNDLELQSHWAKYVCVLSAGLLENALTELFGDFINRAASKPVANYAVSALSKIQNPRTSRFIEIASAFKQDWGASLTNYVDQEDRREAIDSIMTNRHSIAHGKDSNVTLARVKEWLNKAIEVLEFIEQECK